MSDAHRQQDIHTVASKLNNLAPLAKWCVTVPARSSMLLADITHQEPGFMPGRLVGLTRWGVLKLLGCGMWLNTLPSLHLPPEFVCA